MLKEGSVTVGGGGRWSGVSLLINESLGKEACCSGEDCIMQLLHSTELNIFKMVVSVQSMFNRAIARFVKIHILRDHRIDLGTFWRFVGEVINF